MEKLAEQEIWVVVWVACATKHLQALLCSCAVWWNFSHYYLVYSGRKKNLEEPYATFSQISTFTFFSTSPFSADTYMPFRIEAFFFIDYQGILP